MKTLFKNAKILQADNTKKQSDVLVRDNRIQRIASTITDDADYTVDCKGHLLLPGLIDVHIHLREPGGEHKETIRTGTESAAKGGFTTVCAMPNTHPVPSDASRLDELQAKIETDACVRVLPYAAITVDQKGERLTDIETLANKGAFAFTDDGVGVQTADTMWRAMQEAAKQNKAIVAHCEDNSIVYGGVVHDGDVSKRLDLPGLPALSEAVQIARDVLLAEKTKCHYHVCHVSTKESVRVIRDAKKAGISVTAEVTPHHLLLNEHDVKEADTHFKMNPPLRGTDDQEALIEGLLDGTIDFIATDHAPHAEAEKAQPFETAPFGIVGLETAFPLLYTYFVNKGKATLYQLVEWLTTKPATVFQLPYGTLAEGNIADITLIDLDTEKEIDASDFASKGKNTPFNGWKVKGAPILTVVSGKIVYRDDAIFNETTEGLLK